MMGLLFFLVLQLAWSFGYSNSQGGGSFAYSDSTGKKYSGTYGLENGRVVQSSGDFPGPVPFADTAFPGYGYGYGYGFPEENFFPNYFSNLENLLEEAFHSNIQSQKLAYDAAKKAFDLSSNQAGYYPNFATRFPQPAFEDFGGFNRYGYTGYPNFEMPQFPNYQNYPNSAFALAAAGPGYRRQVAAINPANPVVPNVNANKISHYSDTPAQGGYYSVSSKSYASSANVNGQEVNRRGAETVVNENGKVTKYKVQN